MRRLFLCLLILTCGLFYVLPACGSRATAAHARLPQGANLTLLNRYGALVRSVSAGEIVRWKRQLRRETIPARKAAHLHLWLGEIEIARNKEPERAQWHFRQAQRLASRRDPVYGCAAYDRAMTLYFQGAFALAIPAFHELIVSKTALSGYDIRACALWYRHAAACAGYHAQREKLGITEPRRLDPLCGVAALAACLRERGRPYDKQTLLAHCRMTGLGNSMQDLLDCAKRMGLSARAVKADDEGLIALPKPLVAYVELDHFVALTRADRNGVSYLCSDCGAWPGGRRDLTWKQWRAMDCNLYLAVTTPGSTDDIAMRAVPTDAGPPPTAANGGPHPILSALSRADRTTRDHPNRPALWVIRLLGRHVVLYVQPTISCVGPPTGPPPPCNNPCGCGPGDASSAGASAGDSSGPGDTDSSDGGGDGGGNEGESGGNGKISDNCAGPSCGDPVDLATGGEEYRPHPDLEVYNPIGPSVVWRRIYGSLRGNTSPAFGLGWNSGYDWQVSISGTTASLNAADGSSLQFSLPSMPTAANPQVSCPSAIAGTSMLCTWNYNTDGSLSFAFIQNDRSEWVFSSHNNYALSRMVDRNGNYIDFLYGAPGLTAIDDSNGKPLLTIRYNANFNITSVSDRYSRSVYYTVHRFFVTLTTRFSDELTQVSQIVRTGNLLRPFRFNYGYILNTNGSGLLMTVLHTITVPSPMGKGTATATINYSGVFVANTVDANGNTRTYTPVDANDTQVTVTDRKGNVVTSYTVGFDAQMRTTYRTDGTNKVTAYKASYLPDNAYAPAMMTNGNNQTTTYTFDQFGHVQSVTSPRNVTTSYTWDYSVFPLGELKQIQEGTKSPIAFGYYEPSGLIRSLTTPTPGTSGASGGVTTSFTYDALGNVLTVTRPGNNTAASITTTLNYTQDGSYSQPNAIGQPLTVTDNLGHVTHLRFDSQANMVTIADALGNRTDSLYNFANQLVATLAPAIGDITAQIGVTRSQLTYVAATKTYNGTLTLTNTGKQAIQGYLLCALTNLAPGVTLANASGAYVNSPALLSSQVSLAPGAKTTLNISFSAPSIAAVSYGVQTYLTDNQGNPAVQRPTTRYSYLYPGGPLGETTMYDESGNTVRQIVYSYGKEGELLSRTGSTEPVAYTYDAAYRLSTLADGNGNKTKWIYNTAGWLQSVTYPKGDGSQYPSYDAMGHLLKRIDGRGIETDYTYNDPESRLTNVAYVNSASFPNVSQYSLSVAYDGYGRTQDVYDYSGHTHLDYDDQDAETEIDTTYLDANGHPLPTVALTYGFNPDGSRQAMMLATSAANYAFTYGYDAAGRPISLTNPFNETTQWSYLNNNSLSSQQYANGVICDYAYNRRGFLNDLTHYAANGTLLSDFGGMIYDSVANRLTKTVTIPGAPSGYSGVADYVYDVKDQLTQEQSTLLGGYTENFVYDPAGNPLSFKGTKNTFNSDNQFTDSGYAYDGEGNPTTYNGMILTFDPANHLTAFGSILTVGYRADGLRAWKQTANGRTYFIYDELTPVLELTESGINTVVNTFSANGLISRHPSGGSIFYTFDPQGSISQCLDGTGNSLSTSSFDAFGYGGSAVNASGPFGYNGQWGYYSDESGVQLLTTRYYDPTSGHFLTRDRIGYAGGISLYGYTVNGPVNDNDPVGLTSSNSGLPTNIFLMPILDAPVPGFNWCGPGNYPGAPTNGTDASCQAHDQCYEGIGANAGNNDIPGASACDQALINGLNSAVGGSVPYRLPTTYEWLINRGAACLFQWKINHRNK